MKKNIFSGLRSSICKVPDVQHAKEWYQSALGIKPYFDEPFYVGFNVGGYELGLDPSGYDPGQQKSNSTAYWGVEDIEKVYDMLIQAGASAIQSPQDVGGDIMIAVVADPWGNQIGLIYNPHFKAE